MLGVMYFIGVVFMVVLGCGLRLWIRVVVVIILFLLVCSLWVSLVILFWVSRFSLLLMMCRVSLCCGVVVGLNCFSCMCR